MSVVVLILLVSISLFGIEVVQKSHAELRIVKMEIQRMQAVALADSGLEWAKAELTQNPAWTGGERRIGEGILAVSVRDSSGEEGYWVTSEAVHGVARRKLRALLLFDEGIWKILNYEVLTG